ncbi:MAG: recombinase RecA, partial [Myxococcota bacterium]
MASSAALDALRVRIRALEGGTSVRRRRVASGVGPLDVLIGGLPEPGIVELAGPDGSGRVRLALGIAAAWTRAGRSVAWVDPARRLYPPACADLGVGLERLLIVRPTEDGSAPWAWATEQLLRSGCFPLVVIDHPDGGGHRRALAHGWARAAEH